MRAVTLLPGEVAACDCELAALLAHQDVHRGGAGVATVLDDGLAEAVAVVEE